MTHGYGPTVDINPIKRSSDVAKPRTQNRTEGLIDFEQINVSQGQFASLQNFNRCGNRPSQHDLRIYANHPLRFESSTRPQTILACFGSSHKQQSCSTIRNLACISSGHNAIVLKSCFECRQFFKIGGWAHAFVVIQ